MTITAIILAAVVVGGTGLFIGVFLGIAGKKFAVEVDEREEAILGVLPGNNCGGCGYAGCSGLAAAIVKGEAETPMISPIFLAVLLVVPRLPKKLVRSWAFPLAVRRKR